MWTWGQAPFPHLFNINGALHSKQGQFLVLKAERQIGIPPWSLLRDTDDVPNVLRCTLKIRTWPIYTPSFGNSLKPHVIMAWPLSWLTHPSNKIFLNQHFVRDTITTPSYWTPRPFSVSWTSTQLPDIWQWPAYSWVLCIASEFIPCSVMLPAWVILSTLVWNLGPLEPLIQCTHSTHFHKFTLNFFCFFFH